MTNFYDFTRGNILKCIWYEPYPDDLTCIWTSNGLGIDWNEHDISRKSPSTCGTELQTGGTDESNIYSQTAFSLTSSQIRSNTKGDSYEMSTRPYGILPLDPEGAEYYSLYSGGAGGGRDLVIVEEHLDEDDVWKWPAGFTPPHSWIRDPHKVDLIRQVQKEFEGPMAEYHKLAEQSYFGLDKKTIARYLEAAQWMPNLNGKSTGQRIRDTIHWRVNFPLPITNKSLLREELSTGKFFAHETAKNGSPVVYIIPRLENTRCRANNIMALLYTIERAIQSMPAETGMDVVGVVDCGGMGMMNSPSLAFVRELVDVMGRHMPRRLGQLFVCNVSPVFYFLWNVIKGGLSDTTRGKIHLLSENIDEQSNCIGKYIVLNKLLRAYGGENTFIFDVDKYLGEDAFLQDESARHVYF